ATTDTTPLSLHDALPIYSVGPHASLEPAAAKTHYSPMAKAKTKTKLTDEDLIREWRLDPSVTLGSAVRLKGILLEIRARLPRPIRKDLDIEASALVLRMP